MARSTRTCLALIAILCVGVSAAVWRNLAVYVQRDREVVLARNAIHCQNRVANLLLTCEIKQRGYFLRPDPAVASAFAQLAPQVEPSFAELQGAAASLAPDAIPASLKPAIDDYLQLQAKAIDLAAANRQADAKAVIDSPRWQELRSTVNTSLTTTQQWLETQLDQRLTQCRQSMHRMIRWVSLGSGSLLLLGGALITQLYISGRRSQRAASELLAAKTALEKSARAKDEFFGIISHELRTPLTPALLMVAMLEQSAADAKMRDELAALRRQLEIEARLIDDLLDISRIMQGELPMRCEPTRVHNILRDLIAAHAGESEEADLTLAHQFHASRDLLYADPRQLTKAFGHLLRNAIKFTPAGGQIQINSRNVDGQLIVELIDSGIGIPPEHIAAIFRPVYQVDSSLTRSHGGMGVGLALAKAIVSQHGGQLSAQSSGPGQGSTFTVALQLAASAQTPDGPP